MRSRVLRLAAIALLLGLLPAIRAERALACDCSLPESPLVALEGSAAVFSGELVSIDGDVGVILTFEVSRVWKGPVEETLVLTTLSLGAGDCGYPFEAGRAYLVYANGGGDLLSVWLCNGTLPLEYAQEDLKVLGEGQIPGQAAAAPETEDPEPAEVPPLPSAPATGGGMAPGQSTTDGQATGVTAAVAVALAGLALVAFRRRARQA